MGSIFSECSLIVCVFNPIKQLGINQFSLKLGIPWFLGHANAPNLTQQGREEERGIGKVVSTIHHRATKNSVVGNDEERANSSITIFNIKEIPLSQLTYFGSYYLLR